MSDNNNPFFGQNIRDAKRLIEETFGKFPVTESMTRPEREMSFRELQEKHKPWSAHNFNTVYPSPDTLGQVLPILGLSEEVGELAHAILKKSQGIRGSTEHHDAKAKDAIGDIVVFLCSVCSANGWDLQELVEAAWDEIKDRDFKKFPTNGRTE